MQPLPKEALTLSNTLRGNARPAASGDYCSASKPEATGKELIVQVAALREEVDARELSSKLNHENFQAFVGTLPVDSFYRVILGPFSDEASARVVLGKLKKAGYNSCIRRESIAERLGS